MRSVSFPDDSLKKKRKILIALDNSSFLALFGRKDKTRKLSEITKIGGYLVAGGALVGFSAGVYLLLNRALFSFFTRIAQFEVMSYFLAVFIPIFIVLIIIGYLFATTLEPKETGLTNAASLCVLSILCIVLSALSVFYLISFIGGFLILAASIKAYTKPTFKRLSTKEAFFLTEIGAIFVLSFSSLFLLMWLVSNFFETYAMGFLRSYSPHALLLVGVFAFLMFLAIPVWGSEGTNAGLCGAFGLSMTILSYLFVTQNRYVLFNTSAYIGIFMLVAGFAFALIGNLMYIRLFFYEPTASSATPASSLLYHGSYCPYCGKPRATPTQDLCSNCGRSLMWTPYAPFCSSCGRLVPTEVQMCPHCNEDIRDKRVYYNLTEAKNQAITSKLTTESMENKPWIIKDALKTFQRLRVIEKIVRSISKLMITVTDRLSLTFRETVIVILLTYLFGFISFVGYVRVEPSKIVTYDALIFNYGFPLAWLQVKTLSIVYVYDVFVLWIPLVLDIVLYFFAALSIVYGIARLRR